MKPPKSIYEGATTKILSAGFKVAQELTKDFAKSMETSEFIFADNSGTDMVLNTELFIEPIQLFLLDLQGDASRGSELTTPAVFNCIPSIMNEVFRIMITSGNLPEHNQFHLSVDNTVILSGDQWKQILSTRPSDPQNNITLEISDAFIDDLADIEPYVGFYRCTGGRFLNTTVTFNVTKQPIKLPLVELVLLNYFIKNLQLALLSYVKKSSSIRFNTKVVCGYQCWELVSVGRKSVWKQLQDSRIYLPETVDVQTPELPSKDLLSEEVMELINNTENSQKWTNMHYLSVLQELDALRVNQELAGNTMVVEFLAKIGFERSQARGVL